MGKQRLVVMIDDDLNDALRELAKKERRPISDQICLILAAALPKDTPKTAPESDFAIAQLKLS